MKPIANSKPYVLVIVIVPFLGTVLAIELLWQWAIHWRDLELLAAMYMLTGFGLTAGFHRMLTHRSFRAHPVVKVILLVLGSMAVAGPPIEFAATHIKHHAQSDREGDPHRPVEGLFHAHIGWAFKGRFADPQMYCRHLLKDQLVVFVNRTFILWMILSLVIPFVLGGWTGLLWGGLVRIFLAHHISFSVNSICHTFGKREFETNDRSRNQWLVGVLAFGEGWHNNHHAFPRSAFHGLHWWQIDLSGYLIWTLEHLGLVDDVYRVSPALLARSSTRKAGPVAGISHSTPDDDLETAQEHKLEYLCRKLRLQPGQRLLDIGCGWGGLLIYAAQHYGVEADGITLSPQQAKLARERIKEAGLEDRCRVEICDYRDVNKPHEYDKLVSVSMAEHIGKAFLPTYFKQAGVLLRPGGVFLNHGINVHSAAPPVGRDFIHRYVAPDGDLVPISTTLRAAEASGLEVRDVESLREHYVYTLRHWLHRLDEHADEAKRISGEMTYRIWRLFISLGLHEFEVGRGNLYQTLLVKSDKGKSGLPLRREDWYA